MSALQDLGRVLRLHRLGKESKDLGKGFGFVYSRIASPAGGGGPCLWLDNQRILTTRTNRKLSIVTIEGVEEATIDVPDAAAGVLSPPELARDVRQQVIYLCGGDFLIDVRARTASPLKRYELGHDFAASVAVDKDQRHTVYHKGKVIGEWVFNPSYRTQTAAGLIAFEYVAPGERINLGYPDGVAVWNAQIGDWRTLKMASNSLIGWAK